jgi:hypothetical protein
MHVWKGGLRSLAPGNWDSINLFFCAVNPEKSGRKMALLSDFRTDLTLFRRGEYDILLFALAKIFKVRVAIRSWF